ncbi:hypothetical protein BDR07DRAFT_1392118 [Suillus spraguei]|nr:hypothetical protein BDR07DRAFT_1392118 [Suillus spraguei]
MCTDNDSFFRVKRTSTAISIAPKTIFSCNLRQTWGVITRNGCGVPNGCKPCCKVIKCRHINSHCCDESSIIASQLQSLPGCIGTGIMQ